MCTDGLTKLKYTMWGSCVVLFDFLTKKPEVGGLGVNVKVRSPPPLPCRKGIVAVPAYLHSFLTSSLKEASGR